ncbi:MAG TPA: DUF2235 domain-containing protein [Bradyrhizobium sp.]|uniref:T6SS phospholipase effector Tle1-like catalytic domain-containing protein n=1 Tax=Bradyrhizobium sp. TaxID=376 RepID=UPI002BBF0D73|nr:DUF2235 domain-containing protein [Bradyrhizobium sp.]HLZ04505.1 DUF2235 domain-containing protein [Bradyrhizobium sp.]
MARNLVLCLDGTSNEYAADNTNVVKLYAMLERTHAERQLSYYQPGIGTMTPAAFWGRVRRWVVKQIDLATALFLSTHVSDAYRFLMRYYREGDRIFIFGFSRGAYTARAVAAMVHKVGLLTQGNDELISFAWDMFAKQSDKAVSDGFKKTFSRDVPIYFLGLWDTVSSVGWAWDQKSLPYTQNNPSVQIVRHAVALDERRAYFVQNLWGTIPADVEQIWFPGVHCDVGGGYPEDKSGLSVIALKWMTEKAEAAGLIIDQDMKAIVIPAQNTPDGYAAPYAGGPPNESLKGWWWIAEFIPKRFRDPTANFATRWMIHAGRHRHMKPGAAIDPSVEERMRLVPGYKPPNLPPSAP